MGRIKVLAEALPITEIMIDRARDLKAVVNEMAFDCEAFLKLTTHGKEEELRIMEEALPLNDYIGFVKEGKNTLMPFLKVDIETGKVIGHEGRHRAAAVLVNGGRMFSVSIILAKEKYAMREIYPEDGGRPRRISADDVPAYLVGQFNGYRYKLPRHFVELHP